MTNKLHKLLYPSILLLTIYLIFRFVDQSQIMWMFPLDRINDWSSHLAKLFFLAKYGLHNLSPYWYNGYSVLKFYSPGWFFFTLPIYWATGSVQIASFISLSLIYLLLGGTFIYVGDTLKISKIKSLFAYCIFTINPVAISNFIRLGRVPELFGWLTFMITIGVLFKIKTKEIKVLDIIILAIIFGVAILAYQSTAVLLGLVTLGVLITLEYKNKLKLIVSGIIAAVWTAFWWWPALIDYNQSSLYIERFRHAQALLQFNYWLETNIFNTLVIIIFLCLLAVLYLKNKKEFALFLPSGILALLVISRLVVYLPMLNSINVDLYSMFFIFMSLLLIFKENLDKLLKLPSHLLTLGSWVLPLILIISSIFLTPMFSTHTAQDAELLDTLENIDNSFMIGKLDSRESFSAAYHAYGPIKYNLSTPSGWSPQEISEDYLLGLAPFSTDNCSNILAASEIYSVKYLITGAQTCGLLRHCGLNVTSERKYTCLINLQDQV